MEPFINQGPKGELNYECHTPKDGFQTSKKASVSSELSLCRVTITLCGIRWSLGNVPGDLEVWRQVANWNQNFVCTSTLESYRSIVQIESGGPGN